MDWGAIKAAVGVAGALLVGVWGSLEATVQVLLILMAVDILTGVLVAAQTGKVDSDKGWKGVTIKKAFPLLIIVAAHHSQSLLGGLDAGTYVAGFYCATEAISILENAARAGVPVPAFLQKAMARLHEQMDGADEEPTEVRSK